MTKESKSTKHFFKASIFEQIDKVSVKTRIINEIRFMVLDGTLLPGDQLPNELELSEKLNVSRGALRDALQVLERTGFIIRRHGIGTFISENPLKSNNLNVNWGITKVIQSSGDKAGTSKFHIFTQNSNKNEAGHLNIPLGDPIVVLERVRTANGIPIAFTIDQFPQSILRIGKTKIPIGEIKEFFIKNQSLLTFFREILHIDLHHAIASIKPLSASVIIRGESLAHKLGVLGDSNILFIEQVEYLADERPAIYVHEYHLSNYLSFNVYRSY